MVFRPPLCIGQINACALVFTQKNSLVGWISWRIGKGGGWWVALGNARIGLCEGTDGIIPVELQKQIIANNASCSHATFFTMFPNGSCS